MFKGIKVKRKDAEDLLVNSLIQNIREEATPLNDMINFIKDYGNMTKRKKHKLPQSEFNNCRNSILGLPVYSVVAGYFFHRNKRLRKKYLALLHKVQDQLRADIRQATRGVVGHGLNAKQHN